MKSKIGSQGFAHYLALGVIVVSLVIVGAFVVVLKANHDNSKANVQTASSAGVRTKLNANTQTQTGAASAPITSNTTTSTTPSTKSTTSTKSSTGTTAKTTTPTSGTPSSGNTTPTPTPTPLSVLTALISDWESAKSFPSVTANSVTVPGPISNAQARPIVFSADGQTYFAYTQGHWPDFTVTPSQTAGSMAIVTATVSSPSLVQGHLDKANNLVDPNSVAVGYSTGGN